MCLRGIRGIEEEANDKLLKLALESVPSLLIDPADCADPHKYPQTSLQELEALHVVPAESLYRFKPTLLSSPRLLKAIGSKQLFISTFTRLFNYDDEREDEDIFRLSWRIIGKLSSSYEVTVAVKEGSFHERLAESEGIRWIKMGHTVSSQRIVTDRLLSELRSFSQALDASDKIYYLRVLKRPLKHIGKISNASSIHTWAFMLFAALIEQEKKIEALENEIQRLDN